MWIGLHLTLAIILSSCCVFAGGALGAMAALYTAVALHAYGIDPPQVIGLLIMIGFPVAGAAIGAKLGWLFAIRYLPAHCPQCAGRATLRERSRGATARDRRAITYFCRDCGYVYITSKGGRGWTYEDFLGPDWEEQIKQEVALAEGLIRQPVKSIETKPPPKNESRKRPIPPAAAVDRMPAAPVERILAVMYVLSGPVLFVFAPVITASGYVLWQVSGSPCSGLGLFLGGMGTFVSGHVFRAWVVRWGRARWPSGDNQGQNPTGVGSARADASALRTEPPPAASPARLAGPTSATDSKVV
jgi:hypothetical protein